MIIAVKIDVTKINKAKLFPGKGGAKYLSIVLLEKKQVDEWGNAFMVVEDSSKEERESGKRGTILGNGKILKAGSQESQNDKVEAKQPDEDVPF